MGGAICGQLPAMCLTPFGESLTRVCHWHWVSDAMIKGVN